MVKKTLIAGLTAIILSLCCGLCFAAEKNQEGSINLGNEITQSIDKTGQSMQNVTDNVFSTNVVNDMKNGVTNMTKGAMNGIDNMTNAVVNTTETRDNNMEDNRERRNDMGTNNGDYDVTRTTAETRTATNFNTMSTTTWMWIILAVAAIIIIAAIWYYATQSND